MYCGLECVCLLFKWPQDFWLGIKHCMPIFWHYPISAPLSLAVREPQNEGTLSIEHTFVLYCYRLQKRAGKVGNFVTSSAAPVSYHRKLENSATTCLTHV